MYLYGMRDMKSMLSKIMDALATNMVWNEYSLKGRGKKGKSFGYQTLGVQGDET